MSQAPIMPFYTDAYLADTFHLSTEAHGAYILLLLHIWRANGEPPPDDDRLLADITKLSLSRWRSKIRPKLEPFFQREDGHWRQKRLQKEWQQVMQKIDQNRQSSALGVWARKQKQQPPASPDGQATANPSINPHPYPSCDIKHSDDFHAPASPALDALKPILSDVQYFLKGGKRISPALAPQIRAAQAESQALLAPMGDARAGELIARLARHFPARQHHEAQPDYIALARHWPADLGASACDALIASHRYPTLPPISALLTHITPPMEVRRKQAERLSRLAEQVEVRV